MGEKKNPTLQNLSMKLYSRSLYFLTTCCNCRQQADKFSLQEYPASLLNSQLEFLVRGMMDYYWLSSVLSQFPSGIIRAIAKHKQYSLMASRSPPQGYFPHPCQPRRKASSVYH